MQRIVPDGCVDVVWVAGRELIVAGPATAPAFSQLPAGSTTVGVRFRPGAGASALGVPLDALRDVSVPLAEVWGAERAARLADALANAAWRPPRAARRGERESMRGALAPGVGREGARAGGSPFALGVGRKGMPAGGIALAIGVGHEAAAVAAQLDLLERAVLAARADAPPVDRLVLAAAAQLARADAAVRVRDVGDALGVSERQLLRRFRAAVGYGPKTLARVLRFQRFLKAAWAETEHGGPELGRLAFDAGYADQAHLTRDCRDLAGVPPSRLLAGG